MAGSTSDEVTLIAGSYKIQTSKKLLADKSDYFRAMFSGDFTESSQDSITLQVNK